MKNSLIIFLRNIKTRNIKVRVIIQAGVPGGIRTPDLQVRSLPFYPAKLQAHMKIYFIQPELYTIITSND